MPEIYEKVYNDILEQAKNFMKYAKRENLFIN